MLLKVGLSTAVHALLGSHWNEENTMLVMGSFKGFSWELESS